MRVAAFALILALVPAAPAAADDHPVYAAVKAKLKDPAKPFTMVVMLKVKPGSQEAFEAAFAEARKATRKEKGNLVYDLNKASDDDTQYAVYERWQNLDALGEHLKAPHIEKLLKAMPDLIEGEPRINVGFPVAE